MAPTLHSGDVVWAVPARAYAFEGLYVFDLFGTPDVSRAEARGPDAIHGTKDAPGYLPHVMTRAEFEAAVTGQVAAIGRVIAAALLERRASA
jgi:hypothetical protein